MEGGKLAKPRQLSLDNLKDPLFLDSKLIDVIMGMSPCHPSTFIEFWQCARLHVKQNTHTPKFQLIPCQVWSIDNVVCKVYFLSKREIMFPVLLCHLSLPLSSHWTWCHDCVRLPLGAEAPTWWERQDLPSDPRGARPQSRVLKTSPDLAA